jgi:type II secretory pathway pseudopilin PulG
VLQNNRKSGAFTLVELLLGLAITAILLVAVAAALNASAMNYKTNEDIYKAMNNARQALTRMTTQIRTATAVDPDDALEDRCTLITSSGENITFRYNSGNNKLYLITNDNPADPDYVLCDNVTDAIFTKDKVMVDSVIFVKSVQISLTVQGGNVSQNLSAAAVVRRNLQ